MAAFTPSALTVQSVGSMNMTIAHVNEDIISATNYWSSGIDSIRSIMPCYRGGTKIVGSANALQVSWTATDGTIHVVSDLSMSGTGLALWILHGGPAYLD